MHTYKKIIFGLGLTVSILLASLTIFKGTVLAAGFTITQIQNARVYFVSDKVLSVVIGGQSYEFDGSPGPAVGEYFPKDKTIFCSNGATQPSGAPFPPASLIISANFQTGQTLKGVISPADPASGAGNLYAGLNAATCRPLQPNDKTVTFISQPPPGAIFTDKTIGNIKGSDFAFKDGANIIMTFGGKTIDLFDKQPEDGNPNFPPSSQDASNFCSSVSGISFSDSARGAATITANFQVAYYDTTNNNNCAKKTINGLAIANPGKIASKVFIWNNQNIDSITGGLSLTVLTGTNNLVYVKTTGDTCGGGWAIKLPSDGANSGVLYELTPGSGAGSIGFPSCKITRQINILIDGTKGQAPPTCDPTDPTCTGGNNNGGNCTTGSDCGDTCALSSGGFSLAWVMCPLLAAADSVMVSLTDAIESQLSFTIEKNTGNATQQDQVKSAWALIKNIASVLLVVLMLVIVLSQAISVGPFDAYTIRKALPRLVIAVIALQISWPLLSWVVQLGDDLGRGIADLMYAPFGGRDAMSLGAVLSRDGIGAVAAGTISWVGVLGIAAVAAVSLPMILLLAWSAVMALLIVFFVLVFRKILIIFCLILAPLALIMWILPGTQRYWKLWHETLTKLLLMFPLIVGIIAAGRIFGYVAGSQGSELIRFLMIIIGFFGPLFILPKTFSWGGQALGSLSGAASRAGKGIGKPVTGLLEDSKARSRWTQARASRKAELDRRAKLGFTEGIAGGGLSGRMNRARLIGFRPGRPRALGGAGLASTESAIGSRIVRHAETALLNEQEKERQEEIAGAGVRLNQEIAGMSEPARQAHVRGVISDSASTEAQRHVALRQALQDRDYATVESYMNDAATGGNAARISEANRFRNSAASELAGLAPHILKGDIGADGLHQGIMRAADGSEAELAVMHGSAVQSVLSHLSEQAASGSTPEVRSAASSRLGKFLTTYATATQNQNVKGSINPGGASALYQFVNNQPASYGPEDPNTPGSGRQGAARQYDPAHTHISIQPDPGIQASMTATPQQQHIATLQQNIGPGGVIR